MSLKVSRILHAGYELEFEGMHVGFDPIFENPFSRNCFAFPGVRFDLDRVRGLRWDAVFISPPSYQQFQERVAQILPDCSVVRLDPSRTLELTQGS